MSAIVHNFQKSLELSHKHADAPWWEIVYRQAFSGFASMVCVRKDGWAQRGGIDRVVTLTSGRTITIDEKVREKDYGDILLERWSDSKRKVPGWVQKPLACEYIAYAIAPTSVCYVLPTLTLQKAWRVNGLEWVERYKAIEAQNNGYVTVSVAIPVLVLFAALNNAMAISWEKAQPVKPMPAIESLTDADIPW